MPLIVLEPGESSYDFIVLLKLCLELVITQASLQLEDSEKMLDTRGDITFWI